MPLDECWKVNTKTKTMQKAKQESQCNLIATDDRFHQVYSSWAQVCITVSKFLVSGNLIFSAIVQQKEMFNLIVKLQ